MTAVRVQASITVSILMCLWTSFAQPGQTAAAQNDSAQQQTADDFKLIVKIIGLDYSVGNVKVWVTAPDGAAVSKVVAATNLLNSLQDDDNNVVKVTLPAKKDLLQVGDEFTACVKILEDKDKIGKHLACEKDTHKSSNNPESITIWL